MKKATSYLTVGVISAVVVLSVILSIILDGYIWDYIGFGSVFISFILFKFLKADKVFSGTLKDTGKFAIVIVSIAFLLAAISVSLYLTGLYSESAAADLMVRLLMTWIYIGLLIHATSCYLKTKNDSQHGLHN